jgi:hypothetical protein
MAMSKTWLCRVAGAIAGEFSVVSGADAADKSDSSGKDENGEGIETRADVWL